MEYIIIILVSLILLIILGFVLELNIKKLKQIGENKELNKFTNSFPENIDICKSILKKLNNESVNIKEEKESKTSLYLVFNNTISIANIRDSYTRIQTIAHECIHSIQSKKMLWFNFIFTNIYLLYFVIIIILKIFNIIENQSGYIVTLTILGMIHYFIRSILETEAMIKARFIAKEYLKENRICDDKKVDQIIQEYDNLNNIGIKLVNYDILFKNIFKVMIYSFVCII